MAEGKQQKGTPKQPKGSAKSAKSTKQDATPGARKGVPQGMQQGTPGTPKGALITLVCITCGNEKFFDDVVPDSLHCDKCGSNVFREFATPTEPDEATLSQLEEQARSIQYGDSSPQTSPDEVRDLDMR